MPRSPIPTHWTEHRSPRSSRARTARGCLAPAAALALVLLGGGPFHALEAAGGPRSVERERLEAALLYKFTLFVDWPEEMFPHEKTPITIGVLGEDPFGLVLERTVRGKTVKGRRIRIRRSRRLENLDVCHLVFISRSEEPRLREILGKLSDRSVLTVGDMPRFAERGGLFAFVTVDKKIRLKLNVDAEKRSKLKISSKLKRICTHVRDQRSGSDSEPSAGESSSTGESTEGPLDDSGTTEAKAFTGDSE